MGGVGAHEWNGRAGAGGWRPRERKSAQADRIGFIGGDPIVDVRQDLRG
jgi:hypothetical protein